MSKLELHNGYVVCPRCDGNGLIYKVKVVDINEILFACDECEACWTTDFEINLETFQNLSTYLERKGTSFSTVPLRVWTMIGISLNFGKRSEQFINRMNNSK